MGPGFDSLGLAFGIMMNVEPGAETLEPATERHPALVGFRTAGGTGPLGWQSKIPPGKGMGFSGASYVAGVAAAYAQQGADIDDVRDEIWAQATELEGHPDNAAPSTYGGFTVSAGDTTIEVPIAGDLVAVVWIPAGQVSTNSSRSTLPEMISHVDATYNVGHAAQLVAAVATGHFERLARCRDRLHEPYRLSALPDTAAAVDAALAAGALTAFLSGSGPCAAALCLRPDADHVAAALPTEAADAHVKTLEIGKPVHISG